MPGLNIDGPPSLPSAVASQMGGGGGSSPFAGMGDLISGKQSPAAPPSGGGSGALKAQADAVKKVLQSMTQAANAGKNFFSRALELIDKGVEAESAQGPGTPVTPQSADASGSQGGSMSRPPAPSFAG